ncbi:MAG: hypothetical protein KAJ01_03575, partial [Candidatus Hydrogenedentes bacterium]|nr:hypothetical protein [Candidatus Hydrogenedentota bacterium]
RQYIQYNPIMWDTYCENPERSAAVPSSTIRDEIEAVLKGTNPRTDRTLPEMDDSRGAAGGIAPAQAKSMQRRINGRLGQTLRFMKEGAGIA